MQAPARRRRRAPERDGTPPFPETLFHRDIPTFREPEPFPAGQGVNRLMPYNAMT